MYPQLYADCARRTALTDALPCPVQPYVVIPPFTCKQNTILADGTIIAPTQAFTYSVRGLFAALCAVTEPV